jgi:hypothetical protein
MAVKRFFLKEYTHINATVGNRPLDSLYCLCFGSVEGALNVFVVCVTTKNMRNFWKSCFEHIKVFVLCCHDARSRKEQQHSATSVCLSRLVIRNRKFSCFQFQQTISEKNYTVAIVRGAFFRAVSKSS